MNAQLGVNRMFAETQKTIRAPACRQSSMQSSGQPLRQGSSEATDCPSRNWLHRQPEQIHLCLSEACKPLPDLCRWNGLTDAFHDVHPERVQRADCSDAP